MSDEAKCDKPDMKGSPVVTPDGEHDWIQLEAEGEPYWQCFKCSNMTLVKPSRYRMPRWY